MDLRLKLRDDEVETLLECIKLAATYYSSKSVTEITAGNTKGYIEAHEKKSYAWQLFDHIKKATERTTEEEKLEKETTISKIEVEDILDRIDMAATEYEAADDSEDYDRGYALYEEVVDISERLTGLLS